MDAITGPHYRITLKVKAFRNNSPNYWDKKRFCFRAAPHPETLIHQSELKENLCFAGQHAAAALKNSGALSFSLENPDAAPPASEYFLKGHPSP